MLRPARLWGMPEHVVALMTMDFLLVREIPALPGDLRPEASGLSTSLVGHSAESANPYARQAGPSAMASRQAHDPYV